MIFHKPRWTIILVSFGFLALSLFASDYKAYSLYNQEFKAVFPEQPSVVNYNGMKAYSSLSKKDSTSFTASKAPSPLSGNTIGSFNKNTLDKTLLDSLKQMNVEVINFNSTLDKQKNTYAFVVEHRHWDQELSMMLYTYEKRIFTNQYMYRWAMTSSQQNRKIFDKYQSSCNLTK